MKLPPRDLNEFPVTTTDLTALGLPPDIVGSLAESIALSLADSQPEERWRKLTSAVLRPSLPFELHHWLFDCVFFEDGQTSENPPAWFPDKQSASTSNIAAFARSVGADSYEQLHLWSVEHRSDYWQAVAEELGICFSEEAARPIKDSNNPNGWLPAKRFHIVESCFQADPDKVVVTSRDEDGNDCRMTSAELKTLTNRVANGLLEAGFCAGARIGMMLSMSAEAVAAYLGTILAGCVPVSIAESFAPPEIAVRMQLANAKALFTNDIVRRSGKQLACYEKWKQVTSDARAIVIPSRIESATHVLGNDVLWNDFLSENTSFKPVMAEADSELNILFSSGTTGEPKAIPWTHSTPLKCAADGRFHQNIHDGSVVAWPTSLGWMMGPWLIFASLLNRATIALYDGAPNTASFCRFVQDANVTMLGVIPSLVRAWRNTDAIAGLDWSAIETFSSTGECSDAADMLYLMSQANYRPVIEYCGGTEIGGGYITSTVVQPNRPSCFSTPALGIDLVLLNEGQPVDEGEVFLIGPSIGLSQTLLNADHEAVYFAGTPQPTGLPRLRRHGDQLTRLPDGSYRASGRADDAMNLGGIKISAVELERCLNQLPGIVETAAVSTSSGPSTLVIFAVLDSRPDDSPSVDSQSADPQEAPAELKSTMQAAISQNLNPLFRISQVILVDKLPRTASNKIMRRLLRTRTPASQ